MSRNRTLGAPYEQVGVTSSFTTEAHVDRYLVSTPGGGPSVTVTLDPNAQDGDQVVVLDAAGNAVAHPITVVASAGQTIQGNAVINIDGGSLELTFSVGLSLWTIRGTGDGVLASTPAFVDIKQFGPTDTADDTPTFQAAAAALAGTGQSLWLSAGTYNFVSLPVVPANLAIWSVGNVTFAGANAATIANQTLVYGQTPGTAGFCPAWFALTTIFINPTSGNDRASGSTSGTALKTWAESVRRWGNSAPTLQTPGLIITFQGTGHTDDSDPVMFAPTLLRGISVVFTGSLTQVWSGAATLVAAKNRTTPTLLDMTLPAGAAPNQILINTSRGNSTAIVYKASTGNWLLSQPMTIPAIPFPLAFGASPTEDNGWTTGNTITGNTATSINFVQVTPRIPDANSPHSNGVFITQCTGFDPIESNSCMFVNMGVIFDSAIMNRLLIVEPNQDTTVNFSQAGAVNSAFLGGCTCNSAPGQSPFWVFFAGIVGSAAVGIGVAGQGYALDADVIMAAAFNGAAVGGVTNMGLVFWDTVAASWQQYGGLAQIVNEFAFGGPIMWGPGGSLDISQNGHLAYPSGAGAAVAAFTQGVAATRLKLNGISTGHSVIAGTPDVFNGAVALTAAALDAPAGAAGFGGNAFIPGNASISNLSL